MKQAFLSKYPALRSHDYRAYLVGWLISNAGTQMQIVAINWQIYEMTRSPFALAILGATRILPIIFFSLIGGTLVDAYNRKKILLLSQLFQAFFTVVLAVVTITGTATPLILYTLNAILIAFYCIDAPARSAFVPRLVPSEHYGNAVSLNIIGYNMSTVAGPAIAGFIIALWGVGTVYIVDSLSFILLFIALYKIRTNGAIQGARSKPSFTAIKEGLRFVKNKTLIWSTMVLDFFCTFFAEATILLPIFATDILNIGPQYLGFLYAAPFVGSTLVGVTSSLLGKKLYTGRVLLGAIVVYAIGTILFGLSKNYYLSLIALVIVGAGDGMSAIIRNIIRQLTTPDYIRGRMTSINMIFYTGGPRLGEIEAGIVAGLLGAPYTVVLGGICTILVVLVVAKKIPSLVRYRHE